MLPQLVFPPFGELPQLGCLHSGFAKTLEHLALALQHAVTSLGVFELHFDAAQSALPAALL